MNTEGEKFRLERENKQGDPISPQVFTCLRDHIFRKINCSNQTCLNFNGRELNKSRFTEDTDIFARSNGEMQ
jgi:hypothetical protein